MIIFTFKFKCMFQDKATSMLLVNKEHVGIVKKIKIGQIQKFRTNSIRSYLDKVVSYVKQVIIHLRMIWNYGYGCVTTELHPARGPTRTWLVFAYYDSFI